MIDVGSLAGSLFHEIEAALDDRQVAESEEVHLEQTKLLDPVHLVLRDDRRVFDVAGRVGLALDREVLGQRITGDDDGGRVDAVLPAQSLEASSNVDDPLCNRVRVVHVAQLLCGLEAVLMARELLETRAEWGVSAHHQRWHRLGDPIAVLVAIAEDSRGVAHGCTSLDRREGHDLCDMVRSVAFCRVLDHVAAIALVEVHVDVRHLLSTRVQEPLEEQVVADRIEIDDAEAVGDTASGRRATARADPDVGLAGIADQVPHHEEVGREAHVGDDLELEVESLGDLVGEGAAIASSSTVVGQLSEILRRTILVVLSGDPLGNRELGKARLAELELDVRPLCDQERRIARALVVLEQVPHLCCGLEVVLGAVEAESIGVRKHGAGLNAQQRVVRLGIVAVGVVAVIGRQQRRADLLG